MNQIIQSENNTYHIKLYISDTGRLPVTEFLSAMAIRQEYE